MHYQLHDYEIDFIALEDNKIIFSFPEGFYVKDDSGHASEPLRKKLVFHIDSNGFPLESFVFIRRRGRFGWKDISWKRFVALFKKGNMIIHDEYDSKSVNWKMLQLNTNTRWNNIELFITDIEKVECIACSEQKTTVHTMKLHTAPFAKIKSGEKTIELRLYDEKRQKIKSGDQILFADTTTGEQLTKTVKALHIFPSFRELYAALPLLKCGYTENDIATAHPSDMEAYYSPEEQANYGVVGIELC